MKTRHRLVSNSSSSSFIIISDKELKFPDYNNNLIVDSTFDGENEFGWGPDVYNDTESKIIFTYLQTTFDKTGSHLKMLEDVIKDKCNVSKITWNVDGYIDHQSSGCEGENLEMFDSKDALTNFLFSSSSSINLDNDNH